jgi:hypothetical protein
MSKVTVRFHEHVRDYDWFLDRLDLEGARIIGDRDVLCRCPAHDDYSPSLHVKEDDQGLLVFCYAGCSRGDIIDCLEDAEPRTIRPKLAPTPRDRGSVVAVYDYRNTQGEVIYRKLRLDPKSFEFRRPVVVSARTEGPVQHSEYVSWRPGLKDRQGSYLVQPLPYNLPELIGASEVSIVDGEKDADRLTREGIVTTCSPYGMARWKPDWDEYLDGKQITIVADRDEPGYKAAYALAERLHPLRLVEAREGKDAFDHLEAGHGVDAFRVIGQ